MQYNKKFINNLSEEIDIYQIYEQHGCGVVESPYYDGKIIRTIRCSEFDAWIISESMNIEKYGIISKRDSWESPTYQYRRVEVEN
jgi:hypothetical protein